MSTTASIPEPVRGLLHDRMWQAIARQRMELPYCDICRLAVYPPSSLCPHCLKSGLAWRALSGRGIIASWTRFHRTYLAAYPAPYVVIAVRLEEGAVMVANLVGPEPADGVWIGKAVRMSYREAAPGRTLPCFALSDALTAAGAPGPVTDQDPS